MNKYIYDHTPFGIEAHYSPLALKRAKRALLMRFAILCCVFATLIYFAW